jgi:hypothetical protein
VLKDIKLAWTIIILWGFTAHLGHCSTLLEYWDSDKENKNTANISPRDTADPYFSGDTEPSSTLKLFFSCPSSTIYYKEIRSIAIQCSNGQTLETSDWRTGTWLPFVKFGTQEAMELRIKVSDCPVTLTISCLSTFYFLENIRKRGCTDPGKFLSDYKPWSDRQSISTTLTAKDLFYEDGDPIYSCLYFRSSGPKLKGVSYEMT